MAMLTTTDLAAIRTIVHEELSRARRRPKPPPEAPTDPWVDALQDRPPPRRTDPSGRFYVTVGDTLADQGIPAPSGAQVARAASALRAIGYRRGSRLRPEGYQGIRVTPYYLPEPPAP